MEERSGASACWQLTAVSTPDEITGITRIAVDEPERWPKTQRMMLGVVRRAAVKLVPVTDTLAVAEGVETAVAANMLGYGPAWALGSAGAVKNLPVLPGIERLILLRGER